MTGTVRAARPDDLDAVGRIYAGYVLESLATFEVEPPSPAELVTSAAAAGIRQLVAVISDAGVSDSPESASAVLHRRCGFAEVGRLRRVGFKHGQWLDTVLMQRALDGPDPAPS